MRTIDMVMVVLSTISTLSSVMQLLHTLGIV